MEAIIAFLLFLTAVPVQAEPTMRADLLVCSESPRKLSSAPLIPLDDCVVSAQFNSLEYCNNASRLQEADDVAHGGQGRSIYLCVDRAAKNAASKADG